jgi:hypothetical protein
MTNTTTISTKTAYVIALVMFCLLWLFVLTSIYALTMLGVPYLLCLAADLGLFFTLMINKSWIVEKIIDPLASKVDSVLNAISSGYNKTKTWIKGLFSKSEPEVVAA